MSWLALVLFFLAVAVVDTVIVRAHVRRIERDATRPRLDVAAVIDAYERSSYRSLPVLFDQDADQ